MRESRVPVAADDRHRRRARSARPDRGPPSDSAPSSTRPRAGPARAASPWRASSPPAQTASAPSGSRRCSSAKRTPIVWPAASRVVSSRASICASSVALIAASVGPTRNRHQRLLPHGLAAGFDAAFVVALAGPTEAGLQQVVRGERGEPRRQRPRAADQDPHDRRAQIVVRDARRHAVEVRERADVPVEKADLILALVDPREVAARVHQPHQEEPRLPARRRRRRPAPRRSRPRPDRPADTSAARRPRGAAASTRRPRP